MKGTRKPQGAEASAPQGDLAELLAAVMRHPDLPASIHNNLADGLNDAFHEQAAITEPFFIRRALANLSGAATDDTAQVNIPLDCTTAAHTVADLLAGAGTPAVLRTALVHFCAELANWLAVAGECVCSPETTRKHLPALLARAEQRGVVCANGGVMFEKRGHER